MSKKNNSTISTATITSLPYNQSWASTSTSSTSYDPNNLPISTKIISVESFFSTGFPLEDVFVVKDHFIEGQYKYLNIFINGEEFENINGSKAYWEGNSFDKIVTDIVKVIEKQRKDVVYSLSVMESIPYKTQMESLKTFRNESKESIKEMLKQKIIYYDYSTPKVYYPNGYEKNYVNQPWGTCPPVEPYYTVSYQNHT